MLRLRLLRDARNLSFAGFMWVCTTSLSRACTPRSAPRRVVFSHSSFIASSLAISCFHSCLHLHSSSFRRYWLCRLLCGCRLFAHGCSSFVWWWRGTRPWRRWRIGCREKKKKLCLSPCMQAALHGDIYRVQTIVLFMCAGMFCARIMNAI